MTTTLDTSLAALASVKPSASAMCDVIFDLIDSSESGMTCDEVEAATGFRHQTASARIYELRKLKLLRSSGRKRKTRSGRQAIVWEVGEPDESSS